MEDIFFNSVKNIAVIALIAYPLTKNAIFRHSITMRPTLKDKIFLAIIFGLFSILGNLLGIETFNGSLMDSRIVGPVVGGIVAGPMVGILAGFIGGLHRYFLGGFTIVPDFIGTVLAGVISGLVFRWYGKKRLKFIVVFLTGCAAEILLNILILLLAKPTIVAVALVKMIGPTTTIVNAIGVAVFVIIVQDVQYSQNLIGASYAEKALGIARRTLPILKKGLTEKTADEIANIIYDISEFDAVSITDKNKVLAFKGVGSDHHFPGKEIQTELTRKVLEGESVLVVNTKEEIGCPAENCPFNAAVEAPLMFKDEIVGSLKVYKVKDIFHPPDISMITGLVSLLSMQLHYAKLDEQAKLLAKTEYLVLKAQINPHFLFNALSVIKLLIRTDPKTAQNLIINLASFLRRTLSKNEDLLPFIQEIEVVQFYMSIQQARFGERLKFELDTDDSTYDLLFPTFALQPLVENSMNHGLSHQSGQLELRITANVKGDYLVVTVTDNGIGIPESVIDTVKSSDNNEKMGIGLMNIKNRLTSLYGSRYTFNLENTAKGAKVQVKIPIS